MKRVKSLLNREFIEHRAAFLYVPGILIVLLLIAFSTATWRHGASLELMAEIGAKPDGLDIFNTLYAASIVGWTGYLTLMLFFYFASSFSADRKNNALLFWKSMPVSDLEIMGLKTLAGLSVFPIVILVWSFVAALVGFLALNVATATSPFISEINSGTSFWTFINVELSALVFILTTLLWYLPLFTFVGLLGTLLRGWAVPAFILILVMISSLEAIVIFGADGPLTRLLTQRLEGPMQFLDAVLPYSAMDFEKGIGGFAAISSFVPAFLAQVDWSGMVLGWVAAGIFVYAASEYRRRRLAA